MKKTIIIAATYFVGLLIPCFCYSQDNIILKNGDEIQAKVLEVTTDQIKYKKWTNLDGPTYSSTKSEVFMIKYKNGTKDVFNNATVTNNSVEKSTDPGEFLGQLPYNLKLNSTTANDLISFGFEQDKNLDSTSNWNRFNYENASVRGFTNKKSGVLEVLVSEKIPYKWEEKGLKDGILITRLIAILNDNRVSYLINTKDIKRTRVLTSYNNIDIEFQFSTIDSPENQYKKNALIQVVFRPFSSITHNNPLYRKPTYEELQLSTKNANIEKVISQNNINSQSAITKSTEDYFIGDWYECNGGNRACNIKFDGDNYIFKNNFTTVVLSKKNNTLLEGMGGLVTIVYSKSSGHITLSDTGPLKEYCKK